MIYGMFLLISNKNSSKSQCKKKLENLIQEKESLAESIDELQLYNESASHQLNSKIREKEELMVEESIRRLEIKKLRGYLNARADEVFTLENRQVGLQMALEGRTKEIDLHKDMLRIQIKNAEEERHAANSQLRDRVGKIEKLKKRYEILMTQFAPEEGEEEHSQAYYVIKAAQEREELQREGDELDASIRKAEKEIKALENTLSLMNNRNESYRMNIYKAELDSKDIQHKEMLEQQFSQVMEAYKSKREVIQDFQQQLLGMEKELAEVSGKETERLQTVQLLQSKIHSLTNDVTEFENKKERAKKSITRSSLEWHKKVGVDPKTALPEEKDFIVRKMKELGTIALTELNRVIEKTPLKDNLESILQEVSKSEMM